MKLLWVATKEPWPPRDGGRLVQHLTLEALARQGVEVTVVAPVHGGPFPALAAWRAEAPSGVTLEPVPVAGPGSLSGRLRTLGRTLVGEPWTLAAHRHRAVAVRVAELLDHGERSGEGFAVVHAEQLQAWPQTAPARRRGVPVVLRAQNVESDLWRGMAELEATGPLKARLLRGQGDRLARREGRAVAEADTVVTLTEPDRQRLEDLAREHGATAGGSSTRVVTIPAPFPHRLPAGENSLVGEPPVVLLGSGGWPPNRDAEAWLLRDLWPVVRQRLPGAVLHLFGAGVTEGDAPRKPDASGVVCHPAPRDSREAFAPGSVLVVPLRLASGVRMKILEAWARGVPVVATPAAVGGLEAAARRELLEMTDGESLAGALCGLTAETDLAHGLIRRGRTRLETHHAPDTVASRLLAIYHRLARPQSFSDRA